MFTIESPVLTVSINSKGAELQSLLHKQNLLEYMWSADPNFWAKKSPVLFPVVGALKNDTYYYHDKPYHLLRHGFARDKEFKVTGQEKDSITFLLASDADTQLLYPFNFELYITYLVKEASLSVSYTIKNKDRESLFFSIGGHPAFKVPLVTGTTYEQYYLLFNKTETAGAWPISSEGLIEKQPLPFLENMDRIPLTKALFEKDALVFKRLQSDAVSLLSDSTPHGLVFHFPGFPFLGIWAAPNADFICIEPWCGIADSIDTDQQLQRKEGIIHLPGNGVYTVSWKVDVF